VQKHPELPIFLLSLALDNWNLLSTLGLALHQLKLVREEHTKDPGLRDFLNHFEALARVSAERAVGTRLAEQKPKRLTPAAIEPESIETLIGPHDALHEVYKLLQARTIP
jgi:hypothetical protein